MFDLPPPRHISTLRIRVTAAQAGEVASLHHCGRSRPVMGPAPRVSKPSFGWAARSG